MYKLTNRPDFSTFQQSGFPVEVTIQAEIANKTKKHYYFFL
jgi:hypothetical protein